MPKRHLARPWNQPRKKTELPEYTLTRARKQLTELLKSQEISIGLDEVRDVEANIAADLAIPLFRIAKQLGKNPQELAENLANRINLDNTLFEQIQPVHGYLNFKFNPARFSRSVIADYLRDPESYGRSLAGNGRTIVIDYSSPNIAKPFSIGHLRSTIIGQALHNILTWLGYRIIGDNHLGDWGTQFGKLLCAYELWGNDKELARDSTGYLLKLYVRFHDEAKTKPELENKAREWFKKLETGDKQAHDLWKRAVQLSTAEFQHIYELLGIKFDESLGESFYANRLKELINRALEKGVACREKPLKPSGTDEKVILIPLAEYGIDTPLILEKSDGTSLYATREIATAEYRIHTWNPEKILYVVGKEQELYFKQMNAALKLLGHNTPCVHVSFGLIRLPQGRMSTREGRVILLEDVINEAIRRAKKIVADRKIPEPEKDKVARIVGIGAIKYADLSQSRTREVVFDWDKMLALDGDSAPYLQYAHTRCRSILKKADNEKNSDFDPAILARPEEFTLLCQIARFPDAIVDAAATYEPHRIANRLYKLARDFSAFYNKVPVLHAETQKLRRARLLLVQMTGTTIRLGLKLLGIEVPDQM
ncbi:arginine--tRNA ligase [candidate division WOR-3 bacterium JGI_Cruoil_03_51_56]|uniref:Arginine--tRNA ligase n=1 Tax=candidate division WOR-3 bacterium JGI_Cruoil_03_51_56 TaxID=1973747 RepID=A0A235BWW7_UNCW3|nr:MAG: arginine--tRNA ligase [candidate division WOR-3 bacterium JGI_Cruoil_03_51_56]